MVRNGSVLLSLALLLAACAGAPQRDGPPRGGTPAAAPTDDARCAAEPRTRSGNPPFYEVFGERYHVLDSNIGYQERGVASWYGRKFHGRPTASGEAYDMHSMTAAHKTLPLPTCVEVVNLANGRSVVVKINDRGPFVDNRLIDMSYAAALALDMVQNGTALVEVRSLAAGVPLAAPPPRPAGERLYVQTGAFGTQANAERQAAWLEQSGFDNVLIQEAVRGDGTALYRVRVGPVPDVESFDYMMARLKRLNIGDAHLATTP